MKDPTGIKRTETKMKVSAVLALIMALASSTGIATAQSAPAPDTDGASPFTYRYTDTYFVGGGVTPPPPPPPPPKCGEFVINEGFSAASQTEDANKDCVFDAPKYGPRAIGFDYTTAEAFCASTMNGGGRIAKIVKTGDAGTRAIRGNGTSMISSSFQIPGISSITCSIAPSTCNNGEFRDGTSCLPQTNLSCGRLKNDTYHILPAGNEIEMASIGECTFQIPQVTIGLDNISLMGEGQTMQKWVSTLRPAGYNDFDAFISAYGLSPTTGVDYAHWKSNANVPTVPRIAYKMVDYLTIADTGYGSAATLPGNLSATPIASGGVDMPLTTTVTIRFTPEAAEPNGESQIADIDLFDIAGNQINIISSKINVETGPQDSTTLIDFNGSTTQTFLTAATPSRPDSITLTFESANRIGSIAFRAAASNAKFPYSFRVYANAQSATPLFYAGTRQYVQSVKVGGGQWTRILNPVYN
jgi:hypothetical protein